MDLTRREFLAKSLIASGALLATPPLLRRLAYAAEEVASGIENNAPLLIVVQMLGGNDGLNTVIPYKDANYKSARPDLGISASEALTLQNGAALHPSLKSLFPVWNEGNLAIVQNIGYPNPILSHFESMDIWNTAQVSRPTGDGWLARYVTDAMKGSADSLTAVGIGVTLPPMLQSQALAFTCLDGLKFFQLVGLKREAQQEEMERVLLSLYENGGVGAYSDVMKETVQSAFETNRSLSRIAASYQTSANYPKGRFGESLKLAAQILTGGFGTRVVHISYGGFDTHSNQKPQQKRLLQDLADGLAALYQDLKDHGLADRSVIMTASEFGRRVSQNASGGTDHGTASCHFVIGKKVRGGLYGDQPDLENLDNGNLKFKVDFRSLYATIVRDHMGFDPAQVLEKSFPALPFIKGSIAGTGKRKKGQLPSGPASRKEILASFVSQSVRNLIPIDLD